MQAIRVAVIAGVIVTGLATAAVGGAPPQDARASVINARLIVTVATVETIDYTTRTVTLREATGNRVTLKVGRKTQTFDDVRQGDEIVAAHYAEVAIGVRVSGVSPATEESQVVMLAPVGSQPDGTVVETAELNAKVLAIDYQSRKLLLVSPVAPPRILYVDPSVPDFHGIQPGNQVMVRYTEALAISIQRQRGDGSSVATETAATRR
jgi:hypothetical protein